jgi:hypothetical protein
MSSMADLGGFATEKCGGKRSALIATSSQRRTAGCPGSGPPDVGSEQRPQSPLCASIPGDLYGLQCCIGAFFGSRELEPRDPATDKCQHYERDSQSSYGCIGPGLSNLGASLKPLKATNKVLIALLTVILFGILTTRQLSSVWKQNAAVGWGGIILLVVSFLIGQVVMYFLAVWVYSDL